MQYKIPQNVGIEDKIVGPLTLRQLIILAIGFGISYVLFAIMNRLYELNILEFLIIGFPALVATAFAMIRINDISLLRFLFLFLEFSIKPKKRVWDHRGIVATISPDLSGPQKADDSMGSESVTAAQSPRNLVELSRVLDSNGFHNVDRISHGDMDASKDDDLVTQAYFGNKMDDTENMYWRTKDSHKKRLTFLAKMTRAPKTTEGAEAAATVKAAVAEAIQEPRAAIKATIGKLEVKNAMDAGNDQKPAWSNARTIIDAEPDVEEPEQPVDGQTPDQARSDKKEARSDKKEVRIGKEESQVTQDEAQEPEAGMPDPTPEVGQHSQEEEPVAEAIISIPDAGLNEPVKKKRKRKRNRKTAEPVREKPVDTVSNRKSDGKSDRKSNSDAPAKASAKDGEFKFEELQKGEIEINLD